MAANRVKSLKDEYEQYQLKIWLQNLNWMKESLVRSDKKHASQLVDALMNVTELLEVQLEETR